MKRLDQLNDEQRAAFDAIIAWAKDPNAPPFFLLKGYAGTGKTFLVRAVADELKGRIVFTAPTNKATKVLRDTMSDEGYRPECRTIYSLLGLTLAPDGEVKVLSVPEDPVDLTHYRLVAVDEAGMVNNPVFKHIEFAANSTGVKFLFMGDRAQLPPVGEQRSKVWSIERTSELTEVMRYDNQILELATELRKIVDHPAPKVQLKSNFAGEEGVWSLNGPAFEMAIVEEAKKGGFEKKNFAKAIAWRNMRVDQLNRLIRRTIFPDATQPWVVGDRVIFTAPVKDLDDNVIATTDDEGTIEKVIEDWHPIYGEFKIWRVTVTLDDNKVVVARVLHEEHLSAYTNRVERLAQEAKVDRKKWRYFWDFKDSFHGMRHSYAITAHRSQGSTYQHVYVDWRDVLSNPTRSEAFRCLYVACTRAKKALILG